MEKCVLLWLVIWKANGWTWQVLGTTEEPFRDYYFTEPGFMEEIQDPPGLFEKRGDTFFEKLHVIHARLKS